MAQLRLTNEEYKIYAIALREIYKENLIRQKQKISLVILDKTVKPEFFDDYDDRKMRDLSRSFRRKNESTLNLKRQFPVKYKYSLVGQNELDNLLKIGNDNAEKIRESERTKKIINPNVSGVVWKPFHEKFSKADGYYSFSRIGFSSTKKFAVLQVYGLGAYWSSDSTYVLVKTKRGWKIYESSKSRSIA